MFIVVKIYLINIIQKINMAASSKLTNFNPANFISPFVFTFMSLLLL